MKGKLTMTICIGFIALILTLVMLTQFKTVDETDITAIETMRETELRSELASWKTKYEEVETQIEDRETKIEEYKSEIANNNENSNILENEVVENEGYLGLKPVKGEGVIITLTNTDYRTYEYYDILRLVNILNEAGAEAISVNDERIVYSSEITVINYGMILVNTKKISSPYVIKAIGDKKYLESALNVKGDLIDEFKADEKQVEYTVEDEIHINAYVGDSLDFKYAKENGSEN